MEEPEEFKSVKTILYFFKDWNIHDVKRNCLIDLSYQHSNRSEDQIIVQINFDQNCRMNISDIIIVADTSKQENFNEVNKRVLSFILIYLILLITLLYLTSLSRNSEVNRFLFALDPSMFQQHNQFDDQQRIGGVNRTIQNNIFIFTFYYKNCNLNLYGNKFSEDYIKKLSIMSQYLILISQFKIILILIDLSNISHFISYYFNLAIIL